MNQLHLSFLGPFTVTRNREIVREFESNKVRALLVYLAMEPGCHSRSTLATLLWPNHDETSARTNLRQVLYQLRRAIGDSAANPPYLLISRQSIGLNAQAAYTVDVTTFRNLIAATNGHQHERLTTCAVCLEQLRQAETLYHGNFLTGFALDDSDLFEEWRRITQEQLHLQVLDVLHQLTEGAMLRGDSAAAIRYAQRQLAVEPWREEAHRQIMLAFMQNGQRAAALAQYGHCRQVLLEELGIEPDRTTTALYEEIRRGNFNQATNGHSLAEQLPSLNTAIAASSGEPLPFVGPQNAATLLRRTSQYEAVGTDLLSAGAEPPRSTMNTGAEVSDPQAFASQSQIGVESNQAAPLSPLYDFGEMPEIEHFHGRAAELAELTQWLLQDRNAQPARLIAVLGMGGAGKTTLAAKLAQQVAEHFDVVIWRSLLNAPPLEGVLRGWLQLLSRQGLTHLPVSFDEQVQQLLEFLRRQRCLLILDNVESILQSGEDVGEVLSDLADFGRLLQQVGISSHRSCLLLTSRELPDVMAQRMRQMAAVRTLQLSGLDVTAGKAVLQAHGLSASAADAASLVKYYSGNALALQMVATTIVDFFGGDIALFQQAEVPVFDGIRGVLDEQFVRLSDREREIVLWLAIEREPVTAPTLYANFVEPPPMHELLNALRSLQRRSLLEMAGDGFTLQNVAMEYFTERLVADICKEIARQPLPAIGNTVQENDGYPFKLWSLNRYALLKAQAKEYIRQSQARLILQPIAQRLLAKLNEEQLISRLQHLLDELRRKTRQPGYAGGNILNLLLHLRFDLSDFDFSHLCVWQADLRQIMSAKVNFAGADLARSAFTLTFNTHAVHFRNANVTMVAGILNGALHLWDAHWVGGNEQMTHIFHSESKGGFPLIFSANGQMIVAAGVDFAIRIWATENGACLRTLLGHTTKIYSLALNADCTLLASGTAESPIYLWDVRSGRLLQTLDGHKNGVGALAFSPSGRMLASGGSDHAVRLWDVSASPSQGQLLNTLQGHLREIGALAFSPDGAILASGGHDGSLHLWDLAEQGKFWHSLAGHHNIIRTLHFHPEGRLLASGSADQTVRLWELPDRLLFTLLGHTDEIEALSYSPSGHQLASSGVDQRVYLWDTRTGDALNVLRSYKHSVPSACFSLDGRTVASGSTDSLIRLWNVETGQVMRFLRGHTQSVRAVVYSPQPVSGIELLASCGDDRTVCLWNAVSGQLLHTLRGHTGTMQTIAFSPDASLMATGGDDQTIRLWSVAENLRLSSSHHRTISGWHSDATTLTFSPNGHMLLCGSSDRNAYLWAVESGQLLHVLKGHAAALTGVAISADTSTIATIAFDCTVRLWDAVTGRCLAVRDEQVGNHVVLFSPDGELLAYDGADFAIYVWRWRTWELVCVLPGHTDAVLSIHFSPTAPLLVSSSFDGSLRLWNWQKGSSVQVWHDPGPYAHMNITGVTGISEVQKAALRALGAVEGES